MSKTPHGDAESEDAEPPLQLRRTLELAYSVEGVVAARVWRWGGRVAVGVKCSAVTTPNEIVRKVEKALAVLHQPGETWDFGILDDSVH